MCRKKDLASVIALILASSDHVLSLPPLVTASLHGSGRGVGRHAGRQRQGRAEALQAQAQVAGESNLPLEV